MFSFRRFVNLQKWIRSGYAHRCVDDHDGAWADAEWQTLLAELTQTNFWPMHERQIRAHVEAVTHQYGAALAEADALASAASKEEVLILRQISEQLTGLDKNSNSIFKKLEALTPFLATVVLAGVSTYLTFSIASNQANLNKQQLEAAADRQKQELQLARLQQISAFKDALASPNVEQRRLALATIASLGDEGLSIRLSSALADRSLINHQLCIAAAIGDANLAAISIRAGAHQNQPDDDGNTPLMIAAEHNNAKIIDLLTGADVEFGGTRGTTPLMLAVRARANEAIDALLRRGAKLNTEYREGLTAFHYLFPINENLRWDFDLSLRYQFSPETAARLVKTGIKLDNVQVGRRPLLHFIAEYGDTPTLRGLLELGANPNITDQDDYTPLMFAADRGQLENVRCLLLKGADPNRQTKMYRHTALLIAAEAPIKIGLSITTSEFKRFEREWDARDEVARNEIISLLISHGAKIESTDHLNQTALLAAAKRGYPSAVRKLVELNADANVHDVDNTTALVGAIGSYNVDGVRALISAGAVLDDPVLENGILCKAVRDASPELLLMLKNNVSESRDYEQRIHDIIEILIANGASVDGSPGCAITPLMEAVFYNDVWSVKALISHGANPDKVGKLGGSARSEAIEAKNQTILALFAPSPSQPASAPLDKQSP